MLFVNTSFHMKKAHSHGSFPCVFYIYIPTKPGAYRASMAPISVFVNTICS